MKATITNSTELVTTGRTLQVSSMFDVPPAQLSEQTWEVDLPIEDRHWNVGLIVGPSGAGKSTVARQVFGDQLVTGHDWPRDHSVLDAFPKSMGIKEVVGLLTSVGFGSPPSWLRPFGKLSTGEQFRVTVARALAETSDLVVIDEFTSVVDRQVASVASHAIQKALRRADRQFVAVTCHYDVIDWLQPDWVYQPHAGTFDWRELQQRPRVELVVREADRSAWKLFSRHHYLSSVLPSAAKCYVGWIGDDPVAFLGIVHVIHPSPKTHNMRKVARIVVLPDWQGLGIGARMCDWAGEWLYKQGYRLRISMMHPAMVAANLKSPRWACVMRPGDVRRVRSTSTNKSLAAHMQESRYLGMYTFEFRSPVKGQSVIST